MTFQSYFSAQMRSLLVQYAALVGFRTVWAWLFLWLEPGEALLRSLWPNPAQIYDDITWFIPAVPALLTGANYVNYLPEMVLNIMQAVVVVLAIQEGILRFRAARTEGSSRTTLGDLDGSRLSKPWWRVPLLMAFATFYSVCLIIAFFGGGITGHYPGWTLEYAGAWPLWVSLALTGLGFLWGHRFNTSARDIVTRHFGAKLLSDDHDLTQRVHALSDKLGLPRPAVGYVHETNAFAVGSSPKDAAVIIGVPLLRHMTAQELDAVIGHELGHIVSNDMRQMQFAQGYQRMFGDVFSFLAQVGALFAASASKSRSGAATAQVMGDAIRHVGGAVIFVGGELFCKRLSRKREFYADAVGAGLTSPEAMSGALDKITAISNGLTPKENRYAYLMFGGGKSRIRPFATHPSMEARKAALAKGTFTEGLARRASPSGG